jgi:hypothetical protein
MGGDTTMSTAIYNPEDDSYSYPGEDRVPAYVIARGHPLTKVVEPSVEDNLRRAYGDLPETPPEPLPAIMQFFGYQHLPVHLQAISKPFYDLAHVILCLPNNAERAVSLRKCLEAKDAAVRAKISK